MDLNIIKNLNAKLSSAVTHPFGTLTTLMIKTHLLPRFK